MPLLERNENSGGGRSQMHPLHHASSLLMLNEALQSMRIIVQDPGQSAARADFLEISSMFDALYAVTDYSFYEKNRLASLLL